MKYYHATECIFDLIAACGPQELSQLCREVKMQANDRESHHDSVVATIEAINHLRDAGILYVEAADENELDQYDLTDYGYELVIDGSHRRMEYEAHKRATPVCRVVADATYGYHAYFPGNEEYWGREMGYIREMCRLNGWELNHDMTPDAK